MNQYKAVNKVLVMLFNNILDIERKTLITGDFKDITNNDMHIIEAIGIGELKNMSMVSSQLGITVGTLTIGINALVKKGYVVRIRGNKDKRVVFLSLTDKGKRAFYCHEEFHKKITSVILEQLNEEEVEVFIKSLNKLGHYFKLV